MIDQIPPYLPAIERAVLGAMLIDSNAIGKAIELIKPEALYVPVNQVIFNALTVMYENNIPIDQLTIVEHLNKAGKLEIVGGEIAIATLMTEATTSANIEYHCKLIAEKFRLRKLLVIGQALENRCYAQNMDAMELCDKLLSAVFTIRNDDKNRNYATMLDMTLEAHDHIMKRIEAKGELYGITTGFDRLDTITDGWQDGDFIILAALPGVGKTALALNLARNAAMQDVNVAIFSMEMSKSQLGKRFISIESRLDVRRKDFTKEEMTALSDASNRQSKLPIYIDDSSGLTHPELYAKMKAIQNERNVKMMIVDYLQLMSGVNRSDSRRLQIEDITRHIKGYAKELNVPIIMLSQLSRESEKQNRKPRLSDLRESGSIEQDSDIVIFIHEPSKKTLIERLKKSSKYTIDDENDLENIVEIIIGKQRAGPTGSFYMYRHKTYTKFSDLDY